MEKKIWKIKWFLKNFWEDQRGMGVVEVILIIVVLIGLVIIFKTKITEVVNSKIGRAHV